MQKSYGLISFSTRWAILTLAALSLPLVATGQTRYHLTWLGSFGTDSKGRSSSIARAINNSGQVVGEAGVYDDAHNILGTSAFLWQNNTMTPLGNYDATHDSFAYAINSTGDIVGYSTVHGTTHTPLGTAAFVYHNGTLTDLGNFGTDSDGFGTSQAQSINDASQIVGASC